MILKNRVLVTGLYQGKSKFPFWKNLQINDFLEISTQIKGIGRGGNGLYATEIRIENIRSGERFDTTMSMAAGYLYQIKYEQI